MSEIEPLPVIAAPNANRDRLIVFGLILLTLLCYWRVGKCGFVNYDDPKYITENLAVQQGFTGESLKYAFTSFEGGYWHPLTWLTHIFDAQLYGPKLGGDPTFSDTLPGGHHFTNLLFHLADTVLLWYLLTKMTGAVWPSTWVAAMFAVHPMHVESVAWISERKDVLSALFFLLTILAYFRYTQKMTIGRYALVVLAFIAALMSKPITVTTPCVLLLLNVWPIRRISFGRDFWRSIGRPAAETLPLLILSVGSSAITVIGTRSLNSFKSFSDAPLSLRLETSVISYARYLKKLVWPNHLSVFYPYPSEWRASWVIGSCVLVAVITLLVVWKAKTRPYWLIGWLWFAGMLVPVIGLVVTGDASLADRYTYLPYIGLFIAVAWTAWEFSARWRPVLAGLAIASVLACTAMSYRQVYFWQDSLTLMKHSIDVTSPNWTANMNYGVALTVANRAAEAGPYFKEAARIQPDAIRPNINYAAYLLDHKQIDEALIYLRKAEKLDPHDFTFLAQVGHVKAMLGRHSDAVKIFALVLENRPRFADVRMYLAESLLALGRLNEARQQLEILKAGNLKVDALYYRLALIAAAQGDTVAAINNFQIAIDINPEMGVAHSGYGTTLATLGRYDEALVEYELAIKYLKDNELTDKSLAEFHIGQVLEKKNQMRAALPHFIKSFDWINQSIAASPNDPQPQYQLAMNLKQLGRQDEAVVAATKAMELAVAGNNIFFIRQVNFQFPEVPIPTTRPSTGPTSAPTSQPVS